MRLLAVVLLSATSVACGYPEFGFAGDHEAATADDTGAIDDTSVALEDAAEEVARDEDVAADTTDTAVADALDAPDVAADVRPDVDAAVDTAPVLVTLLARGGTWRYLDNNTVPGTTWRGGGGFDDSMWKSGAAKLGYGDSTAKTVLERSAPDSGVVYTTYYFRRFITVTGAAGYDQLIVRLLRDDGAIVYLNGVEVARSNMPSGAVTHDTFASSVAGGSDETTFHTYTAATTALREGSNVIAAEVHQANATSSDLGFDLELVARKK